MSYLVRAEAARVDVGCLEEAIANMEQDEKGEWGDVLFVPAGSLEGGGLEAPAEEKGKVKSKAK